VPSLSSGGCLRYTSSSKGALRNAVLTSTTWISQSLTAARAATILMVAHFTTLLKVSV